MGAVDLVQPATFGMTKLLFINGKVPILRKEGAISALISKKWSLRPNPVEELMKQLVALGQMSGQIYPRPLFFHVKVDVETVNQAADLPTLSGLTPIVLLQRAFGTEMLSKIRPSTCVNILSFNRKHLRLLKFSVARENGSRKLLELKPGRR